MFFASIIRPSCNLVAEGICSIANWVYMSMLVWRKKCTEIDFLSYRLMVPYLLSYAILSSTVKMYVSVGYRYDRTQKQMSYLNHINMLENLHLMVVQIVFETYGKSTLWQYIGMLQTMHCSSLERECEVKPCKMNQPWNCQFIYHRWCDL